MKTYTSLERDRERERINKPIMEDKDIPLGKYQAINSVKWITLGNYIKYNSFHWQTYES